LLVHARGDEIVPLECSLRLAGLLRGPTEMIILPQGGHSTAQGSPQIHRRVAGWLAEQLAVTPS
jgi:dipeptidyl aminopeptidase/acylaminoacyl peptidase